MFPGPRISVVLFVCLSTLNTVRRDDSYLSDGQFLRSSATTNTWPFVSDDS